MKDQSRQISFSYGGRERVKGVGCRGINDRDYG